LSLDFTEVKDLSTFLIKSWPLDCRDCTAVLELQHNVNNNSGKLSVSLIPIIVNGTIIAKYCARAFPDSAKQSLITPTDWLICQSESESTLYF